MQNTVKFSNLQQMVASLNFIGYTVYSGVGMGSNHHTKLKLDTLSNDCILARCADSIFDCANIDPRVVMGFNHYIPGPLSPTYIQPVGPQYTHMSQYPHAVVTSSGKDKQGIYIIINEIYKYQVNTFHIRGKSGTPTDICCELSVDESNNWLLKLPKENRELYEKIMRCLNILTSDTVDHKDIESIVNRLDTIVSLLEGSFKKNAKAPRA